MYRNIRKYSDLIKNVEDENGNNISDEFIMQIIPTHLNVILLNILESFLIKEPDNFNDISNIVNDLVKISDFLLIDIEKQTELVTYIEKYTIKIDNNIYNITDIDTENIKIIMGILQGKNISKQNELINKLCYIGSVQLIKWLKTEFKVFINLKSVKYAIFNKHIYLAKYIIDTHLDNIDTYICDCKHNSECYSFMYRFYNIDNRNINNYGLRYTVKNHFNMFLDNAIDNAAYIGDINIIENLVNTYNKFPDKTSVISASENGQIKTIKFLVNMYNTPICEQAVIIASKYNKLETVKFLVETYDAPIQNEAVAYTAYHGSVETIKFLLNRDSSILINELVIGRAAENNHFSVIKFLYDKYTVILDYEGANAIAYAAHNGHNDMIDFLINTYNAKPNVYAVKNAILNGHTETVKLLITKYCIKRNEYDIILGAISCAFKKGHIKTVNFLKNHGTLSEDNYNKILKYGLSNHSINTDE